MITTGVNFKSYKTLSALIALTIGVFSTLLGLITAIVHARNPIMPVTYPFLTTYNFELLAYGVTITICCAFALLKRDRKVDLETIGAAIRRLQINRNTHSPRMQQAINYWLLSSLTIYGVSALLRDFGTIKSIPLIPIITLPVLISVVRYITSHYPNRLDKYIDYLLYFYQPVNLEAYKNLQANVKDYENLTYHELTAWYLEEQAAISKSAAVDQKMPGPAKPKFIDRSIE